MSSSESQAFPKKFLIEEEQNEKETDDADDNYYDINDTRSSFQTKKVMPNLGDRFLK